MAIRTDYDRIAERYDEDRKDRRHEPHWFIKQRLDEGAEDLAVLDLGCGPGRWLGAQIAHFEGGRVRWVGLDPFAGMLALAGRNAPGAELVQGRAEAIPFPDAAFDFINSQVSFHHFVDKEKALDEVVRVLRPGGIFAAGNIDALRMHRWWPYVFFPESRKIDEAWFWPVERLVKALTRRDLVVDHTVSAGESSVTITEMLAAAERRTLSQLAALDDDSYRRGVERLLEIAAHDPAYRHADEGAWLNLTARKAD
jgi:ubiquinone/menaquinone biosynthesis C-methylase UbiE